MGEYEQQVANRRTAAQAQKAAKATSATEAAVDRAKLQGSVLQGKKDTSDASEMPKQNAGESPGAYMKRLRTWREGQARQKALSEAPKEVKKQ